MSPKKRPVRHHVRSYQRRDGTDVRTHQKGSGSSTTGKRSKKVLGLKPVSSIDDVADAHSDDINEEIYEAKMELNKEAGGPTDRWGQSLDLNVGKYETRIVGVFKKYGYRISKENARGIAMETLG